MTPEFIAAVLEGFEAILDAVLDRLESTDLRREIKGLQELIARKRRRIETASLL